MSFSFQDFFSFDKMITPAIIRIIFILAIIVNVIAGLVLVFQGGLNILVGIVTIVIGPILIRVYAEILIVIFQIHRRLGDIDQTLQAGQRSMESGGG